MDFLKLYEEILDRTEVIALASAADNAPNVRVVDFIRADAPGGLLYFATFPDSVKAAEFKRNSNGAFTTPGKDGDAHVRAKNCAVRKSLKTLADVKDAFVKKYPIFEQIFAQYGDVMEVWEIHFSEATVVANMGEQGTVQF